MDLKMMLDKQLRGRHAATTAANSTTSASTLPSETDAEAAAIVAQRHDSVDALGSRPVTHSGA